MIEQTTTATIKLSCRLLIGDYGIKLLLELFNRIECARVQFSPSIQLPHAKSTSIHLALTVFMTMLLSFLLFFFLCVSVCVLRIVNAMHVPQPRNY